MAKVIEAFGKPVMADIKNWSLDMATAEMDEPYVAGLPTESVAIQGFWGPEDEICIVCKRGTSKEVTATATTDTDPAEYIGIVCRECALKALEGAKK